LFETSESIIRPYLDPGERLLWSGQPRTGIRFRSQDLLLIPFSLFWGGFAIFWEVMALTATRKATGPAPIIFPIFGIPFVLIGLYLIFGRFFFDARTRARTFYGVTNQRIIIFRSLFSRQLKSLQLSSLGEISYTERPDGSGTITFGPRLISYGNFAGASWRRSGRYAPPCFDLIEGVKDVYDTIRAARKPASHTL
jgi:hypothetical protein